MQNLPNEILREIFALVPCKDLLSASLVSHRILHIVQPILYEKPNVLQDYDSRDPLPLFLRTLLHSPSRERLAGHVRSLDLDMRHLADTPPAEYAERGAKIVRLLGLLPRLTSLDLGAPYEGRGSGYEDIEAAVRNSANLPLALRTVRKFISYERTRFTGVTTSLLATLMCLPSISEIFVSVTDVLEDGPVTDQEVDEFATVVAPRIGTSPVTDLTMRYGDIRSKSLAAILTLPKALIRFTYVTMMPDFNLLGIGHALLPLQHSLQCLHLQFYDTRGPCAEQKRRDSIGSLRGWTSLQSLQIQLMSLLGRLIDDSPALADVLPLALRVLRIDYDTSWTAGEVVQQVTGALEQGELAALREVWVYSDDESRTKKVEDRFLHACYKANVKSGIRAGFY